MRVDTIINHNQSVWQEVSLYWNDEISQRFHSSVILEMDNLLNSFNSACDRLETETSSILSEISRLEYI